MHCFNIQVFAAFRAWQTMCAGQDVTVTLGELAPILVRGGCRWGRLDQTIDAFEHQGLLNHPIALANVLANEGGIQDLSVLCAAILHDTIEDTETTAGELEELFGSKVTSIVFEVTDDKSLEKHVRKQRQIE